MSGMPSLFTRGVRVVAATALLTITVPFALAAQNLTSPEEFFGHQIGAAVLRDGPCQRLALGPNSPARQQQQHLFAAAQQLRRLGNARLIQRCLKLIGAGLRKKPYEITQI